jgi:tRNA pseudouridine38-40 synthase
VLEDALTKLFGDPVKVTGAGRTDSGVHASGQVISFTPGREFPLDRLQVALQSLLPKDLSVRDAAVVDDTFSARFSARERTYVYVILNRSVADALLARYACNIRRPLDEAAMRAGAAPLVGQHDFSAFAAVVPGGNPIRTLRRLDIERFGDSVRIEVVADGFLHHMVRSIVGTLVECGAGRRDPESVAGILASGDRASAGPTAPPHGLYLAGVRYADGYDSFAEPFAGRPEPGARLTGHRAFP